MIYPRIVGWGKGIPQRVLTNQDLERMMETSDEWIRTRTGIRERCIAAPQETASTLAAKAGRDALMVAGLCPEALDLVIAATCSPDKIVPATASLVQDGLRAQRAGAFDLNAGCSGFVYGLTIAYQFVAGGVYRNILVVGTEVLSRYVNWEDRATCVLFADGAGAVVVSGQEEPVGGYGFVLGSDGSGGDLLYITGICGRTDIPQDGYHHIVMNGPEVFKFAVKTMAEASRQAIGAAGLGVSDIELFIPHQANERIIQAAVRSLGLPQERVFVNIQRYGNTSAASIAIALCEAVEGGRLKKGDHLLMAGFGAGLSWAAMVIEF